MDSIRNDGNNSSDDGLKTENREEKKPAKKRGGKIAVVLVTLFAAVVLAYVIPAFYYSGHFLPNTSINGVDVSNMTTDQAKDLFAREVSGYTLTLKERNDVSEQIKGTDIDLQATFDSSYDDALSQQNAFTWPICFFESVDREVSRAVSYNEEKLNNVIANLKCMDESTWIESTNATVSEFDTKKGEFSLVDGTYGTQIIEENLVTAVKDALNGVKNTLNLSNADCYINPTYPADSKAAKTMLDSANKYASVTITYTFGKTNEVVDGTVITKWLDFDYDNMSVSFNKKGPKGYVKELAERYDTVDKDKTLESSWGETVTVKAGTYGWKIDQDATYKQLLEYIESGEDYTGDVVYTQTAESHDGADFGDTYVEVNISKQHLYLYIDGEQIVSSDFVSGCVSKGRATSLGAYYVAYKQRNATLRGQNYSTPVDYWMPFFNGQGLHDATWRYSFGGSIFMTGGSHGCVNLPHSAAKQIYEAIDEGIAVLVYDPEGKQTAAVTYYKNSSKVINLIEAIGNVTKDSKSAIEKARKAYDALSDSQKSLVSNYSTLKSAEEAYEKLTDSDNSVKKVISLIDKIGTVDKKSGKAIKKARSAYDALSKKEKKKVTNYKALKSAEKAYAKLKD